MNQDESSHVKKFAIECRKIRLWLRDNPGATSYEIKKAMGGRYDLALQKMHNMGIVTNSWEARADGGRTVKWFVVPQ